METSDQRSTFRVRKILNLPGTIHRIRSGEEIACSPIDVSSKGLGISTHVNILPDTQVMLKIGDFNIVLSMIWCKPMERGEPLYRYGFKICSSNIDLLGLFLQHHCIDVNVLIVEDEEPIADIYNRVLTQEGYRVRTATDPKMADCALEEEHFDFVISDWVMPKGGGLAVVNKTTEMQIPTAILTGFTGKIHEEIPETIAIHDKMETMPDDLSNIIIGGLTRINNY